MVPPVGSEPLLWLRKTKWGKIRKLSLGSDRRLCIPFGGMNSPQQFGADLQGCFFVLATDFKRIENSALRGRR